MGSVPRFYVYVLARPNNKPFYVGKGKGSRVYNHESEARSGHKCHKCNVIRKIWRNGGEVQRYIVFTTDDEAEALAYEVDLIALFGRKSLSNATDGGEGVSNPSPETRAKIGASSRKLQTRLGHTNSPEHRAKISAAHRGKKLSETTIRKIADARRGKPLTISDEERSRRAERIKAVGRPFQKGDATWNKGTPWDEETRRKISEKIKALGGRKHTDEAKQRMREIQRSLASTAKTYELIDPGGAKHIVQNLKRFCEERGWRYDGAQRALHNQKTFHGWYIRKISD